MTWRIGLLIPASNAVMEVDCYRSLPHDATLHVGRMHQVDMAAGTDEEDVDRFVIPAANALAAVFPHVVVFDCYPPMGTMGRAQETERRLGERVAEATGALAVGVRAAMFQSLRDNRASQVAVVSPYGSEVNRFIKADLESGGLTVSGIHGMGLSGFEAAAVTSDDVYAYIQSCIGPRVAGDALVVAGTNLRAFSALSLLKISYDVPIVTSNLAVLQAVKRELEELRQRELARLSS
jgi:maleate isomerase